MPRIKSLSRELLLDVLDALAEDMSDSKLQDLSCTSLNSDSWNVINILEREY